jgi:hypothetical protein
MADPEEPWPSDANPSVPRAYTREQDALCAARTPDRFLCGNHLTHVCRQSEGGTCMFGQRKKSTLEVLIDA